MLCAAATLVPLQRHAASNPARSHRPGWPRLKSVRRQRLRRATTPVHITRPTLPQSWSGLPSCQATRPSPPMESAALRGAVLTFDQLSTFMPTRYGTSPWIHRFPAARVPSFPRFRGARPKRSAQQPDRAPGPQHHAHRDLAIGALASRPLFFLHLRRYEVDSP